MDLLIPCFSSSTTMGTESKPRFISPSIAYRREAEAAGRRALAECHLLPDVVLLHVNYTDRTSFSNPGLITER